MNVINFAKFDIYQMSRTQRDKSLYVLHPPAMAHRGSAMSLILRTICGPNLIPSLGEFIK